MSNKVYVFCVNGCMYEGMTKEQILAAITQAINEGTISNIDAGFITKIKEINKGATVQIWRGTEAEYNAVKNSLPENVIVYKTDDSTISQIQEDIKKLEESLKSDAERVTKILNGETIVPIATYADGNEEKGTIDDRLTLRRVLNQSVSIVSSITFDISSLKRPVSNIMFAQLQVSGNMFNSPCIFATETAAAAKGSIILPNDCVHVEINFNTKQATLTRTGTTPATLAANFNLYS